MLHGGTGNDSLRGGGGDDVVHGDDDKDAVFGDLGDDTLHGGDGNDYLCGGGDCDVLFGGNGDDGLFGGTDNGSGDTLVGGAGGDRFLTRSGDDMNDITAHDVQIRVIEENDLLLWWIDAECVLWAEEEIAVLDQAFAELQARAGTRILKDTLYDDPLTFVKVHPEDGWHGMNVDYLFGRRIYIKDWDENSASDNNWVRQVVFHEIGHNWDTEGPMWDDFMDISDWRWSMQPPPGHVQAHDPLWWYAADSTFARDYGRTNPCEDWATAFAATMMDYAGWNFRGTPGTAAIPEKVALINQFLDNLNSPVGGGGGPGGADDGPVNMLSMSPRVQGSANDPVLQQ